MYCVYKLIPNHLPVARPSSLSFGRSQRPNTDPVFYQIPVDPETTQLKIGVENKTYYFCSSNCKDKFEHHPKKNETTDPYEVAIRQSSPHGMARLLGHHHHLSHHSLGVSRR
ncbi:YHS domain-containing protein [Nitrosococcus halophilus]|uniref:YHS domain-containing protein n=1 Tax=Nitrosococcus halophilus TaxID=133539 RepID=UPI000A033F63